MPIDWDDTGLDDGDLDSIAIAVEAQGPCLVGGGAGLITALARRAASSAMRSPRAAAPEPRPPLRGTAKPMFSATERCGKSDAS